MRRALILDCDGVLADTEREGHLVAFNQTFAEFDFPFRWSVEEYGELLRVGGGKERMKAYLRDHPEHDLAYDLEAHVQAAHMRKSAIYIELVESGRLVGRPGVARIVEEALDAGWQVACASTSALHSVEAVLHAVVGPELRSRMDGVFAGDIVAAKKPAPDIYLHALEMLGQNADSVVVIEDSQSGAAAAAAAGLPHLVTVSQYTRSDSFPDAASVVNDLGELGSPASLLAGLDVRNAEGCVDLAGLERILASIH